MVHNQQLHAVCFNLWGFSKGIMIDMDDVSHSAGCHHATDGLLVQHFWRSDVATLFFSPNKLSIRRVPFVSSLSKACAKTTKNSRDMFDMLSYPKRTFQRISIICFRCFPGIPLWNLGNCHSSPKNEGLPRLPSGGSLQGILQLRLSICLSGRSPWNCGVSQIETVEPQSWRSLGG